MPHEEQTDLDRRVTELEAEVKAVREALREIARRLAPRGSAPLEARY